MEKFANKKCFYAAIAIALAALLVLSLVMLVSQSKTAKALEALANGDTDVAQEDDVVIAEDYTIKSTLNISDAYKNGKTSSLSDKDKETLDMASEVLDEIITDGMSDYEKELAVYEWMTHNLSYDTGALLVVPNTTADSDNPYGVLKYHNAVCVGYATTFRMFMQMLDIDCMVVHNSARYHTWDLVKIDGNWYHTDIYSDVGLSNYNHFNLTDDMQGANEEWNRDFFPAANCYDYNYAVRNSEQCKNIYSIPEKLREAVDNQQGVCALSFKEGIDEAKAMIVASMLDEIISRLYSSDAYYMLGIDYRWASTDDGYVLCIYINGYETDEPSPDYGNISDEDYEKLTNAVEGSFGDIAADYYSDDYTDYSCDGGCVSYAKG